jgi:hypothetical protein
MLKSIVLGLFASVLATTLAVADQPGADWIGKAALKTQMQAEGYSGIIAEADDGHWEGEAIKDGRIVEFHADPRTGKITKSEPKTED